MSDSESDFGDVKAIVCDNGTGMVKVRRKLKRIFKRILCICMEKKIAFLKSKIFSVFSDKIIFDVTTQTGKKLLRMPVYVYN